MPVKRWTALWMALLLILCFAVPASAAGNLPETVKIGLFYAGTAKTDVAISCDGDLIVYYDGQELLRHNPIVAWVNPDQKLILSDGDMELAVLEDKELKFAPTAGFIKVNGKAYRGSLELINLKNGKMTVINKVNLEEYLYGVVPKELSTGMELEALKAQAVCARTYAATQLGRFQSQGFDMTDTTLSQVYGGVSVEAADCTRAVEETRGQVVLYDGKPAQVFYSATSSGHTFHVKDVWGSDIPYLAGVDDPYQESVKPGNDPWKVTYTKEELKQKLAAQNVNIGDIVDVNIEEKSPEGAVTKLKFTGTQGEKVFEREQCRIVLNLRSQGYDIEKKGQTQSHPVYVISADGVTQAALPVFLWWATGEIRQLEAFSVISQSGVSQLGDQTAQTPNSGEFVFSGTGNGHGVGMSQNGAIGMAKAGFGYQDILTHYFTGTQVGAY